MPNAAPITTPPPLLPTVSPSELTYFNNLLQQQKWWQTYTNLTSTQTTTCNATASFLAPWPPIRVDNLWLGLALGALPCILIPLVVVTGLRPASNSVKKGRTLAWIMLHLSLLACGIACLPLMGAATQHNYHCRKEEFRMYGVTGLVVVSCLAVSVMVVASEHFWRAQGRNWGGEKSSSPSPTKKVRKAEAGLDGAAEARKDDEVELGTVPSPPPVYAATMVARSDRCARPPLSFSEQGWW